MPASDAIALAFLADAAEREGAELHVFGGAGYWLLEWRVGGATVIASSESSVFAAVHDLRERVGVDW